jgi:diguanylate cyclase (GGDEF)-like protein
MWIAMVGVMLIGFRNKIPDLFSIVLANALLVTANVLTLKGIAQHVGLAFRWRWPGCFILAYSGCLAWFAYVVPDLSTRLTIGSLQAMAFNLAYAYLLLRYGEPSIRTSCRIAAAVMFMNAGFYLVRVFMPVDPHAGQDIMMAGTPVAATYVVGIIAGMATYFALLQLITERLMVDLRRAAHTDGLTGLLNRSAIVAKGRASLERAAQRGQPFSLIIFDLDYFKQINDRWGHDAGDAVLRHVTTVLREHVHWPGLLASRYGGEEFVLALPDATLEQALAIAERLRQALAHSHARVDHHAIPVTASIGVAAARPGTRFEQLVRQADEAMYRTKFDGRNGVSTANPDDFRFAEVGNSRC